MDEWTVLADALLAREATLCRIARGVPPDELAGLHIDDDEVAKLLDELTGELPGGADPGAVAAARESLDRTVDDARSRFADALRAPSPISGIVATARLDEGEAEVLAFLGAVELDPRRQRLVGYIQDDVTRRRPTLFTLGRVFGAKHPGPLVLGESGRLRRASLVDVVGDGPWSDRVAALHPTVAWALAGDRSPDPALPVDTTVTARPDDVAVDASAASLVVVTGEDRIRRLQTAVTSAPAREFLVASAPAEIGGWEALVREATLGGFGIVVELEDTLAPAGRRVIERADHVAWALLSVIELRLEDLPRRPWTERRASGAALSDEEWEAALGEGTPRLHPLTAHQLHLVSTALPALDGDLHAAVRRLAGGSIDRLARRIRPARGWDDLVLPPERFAHLRELTSRYRHRATVYEQWGFRPSPSAGLVALFSGQSGTGKTMAAEIVAGDLGLDLFKLDLSSVVSKYIGETEKNLEEVFAAAAAGNLVLFFDEADALFGKRSDVGDAHDRYANIEVSYLLQRLESYDGVVIMATNFQKNIDTAFLRRIHAVVEFPMPEEPERRAIWERNLEGAPTDDVDLDFLAARFTLAGGSIRNAALTAAFLAAEAGTPITMEAVVRGLVREFQKLGRLVTAADFGAWYGVATGEAPGAPASP